MPTPQEFAPKGMVMRCGKPCRNSAAGMRRSFSFSNKTRRKTLRTHRRRSLTAATRKSGGTVIRAISGRLRSMPAPPVPAAPTALAKRSDRTTISHRGTRNWLPNGMRGKTHRESPPNSPQEATALCGGSVRKGIPGGPRSTPGSPAAAARSVLENLLWQARTHWQMSLRNWLPSGTWRKTPH